MTENLRAGLDRRTLLKAGAWAAPVVVLATAAPAAAASAPRHGLPISTDGAAIVENTAVTAVGTATSSAPNQVDLPAIVFSPANTTAAAGPLDYFVSARLTPTNGGHRIDRSDLHAETIWTNEGSSRPRAVPSLQNVPAGSYNAELEVYVSSNGGHGRPITIPVGTVTVAGTPAPTAEQLGRNIEVQVQGAPTSSAPGTIHLPAVVFNPRQGGPTGPVDYRLDVIIVAPGGVMTRRNGQRSETIDTSEGASSVIGLGTVTGIAPGNYGVEYQVVYNPGQPDEYEAPIVSVRGRVDVA